MAIVMMVVCSILAVAAMVVSFQVMGQRRDFEMRRRMVEREVMRSAQR